MDALITPVSVSAAPQLGKVGSGGYCSVWNLLDYPSATVPVTTVDRDVDVKRTGFTPLTEKDRVANEGYDPEVWHGGPVSVQIVARRFEDEKLLEVLRVVDGLLEWGKE